MHRFTALITISALSTMLIACEGRDEDRDQAGNDLQSCVEEAMMDFVFSPAHTAAMAEAAVVGMNGAVTSWEVTADEVPMS